MSTLTSPGLRYRIILRGECERLLAGSVDEGRIEARLGWTCVIASVRDESQLYGLLDRFEEFALHLVSLNELGADDAPVGIGAPGLDARTHALVRLAAAAAADEHVTACGRCIAIALDHGVTPDEISATLTALSRESGPG
jgi:hypothetical protein